MNSRYTTKVANEKQKGYKYLFSNTDKFEFFVASVTKNNFIKKKWLFLCYNVT